jgi:hypothetical protein
MTTASDRPTGSVFAGATWCPWLRQPRGSERLALPHGHACALRAGVRQAPSADELAWLCTNGRAHACPSYRRRAAGAAP